MIWSVGEISVPTTDGSQSFVGWTCGSMALDFRPVWLMADPAPNGLLVWHLTHILTGHGIGGLVLPLADARQRVEALLSVGNWTFTDIEAARFLYPHFRALREDLGHRFIRSVECVPPWSVDSSDPEKLVDMVRW